MTAANININVITEYIEEQSNPDSSRYVFAYTITISNNSNETAQLIDRHWIITDSNGKIQEVKGDGVVGEQPTIEPGKHYSYQSGAIIETPVGSMQGSYGMKNNDGERFDAPISRFSLSIPRTLH